MNADRIRHLSLLLLALTIASVAAPSASSAPARKQTPSADAYAEYVWPPPDVAKIKLDRIFTGRADVEASSRMAKVLTGATPGGAYDFLQRPIACAFDNEGRLLVTDAKLAALVRFDAKQRRMDVFGTKGSTALKTPLGVHVGPDGLIYVADSTAQHVVVFDGEGKVVRIFGRQGELQNPTDAIPSNDGKSVYVTDSKAHSIVVYDAATAKITGKLGKPGTGEGEFNFPSAIAVDREGFLYVVDQMNARVQILSATGEFVDQLGDAGTHAGQFVRPKFIALDQEGRIYVTDGAFGNVQIFDSELRLLTFVGEGGENPGQFQVPGGVAVRGNEFAIVDQLGRRVQLFRYLDASVSKQPRANETGKSP